MARPWSVVRVLLLVLCIAGPAGAVSSAPAPSSVPAGLQEFQAGRFSEAVTAWRGAAEAGDPAAALYLGVLYDTGFGVVRDEGEALAWYRQGGEAGNPTAMLNAAIMFDAGRGTAADPAAAAEWYRRAAAAGSGRGAYNLGLLYESGAGVPVDRAAAMRFFRLALANGVPAARGHLPAPDRRAAGPATVDPAMVLFQRAQRALLARGAKGDAEAADLFRQAATAGSALAAYNLGYCYEYGIGVTVNIDQALSWYRRSAASAADPALRAIASRGAENLLLGVDHVQR